MAPNRPDINKAIDAEPIDNLAFQDAMELAPNDDYDGDMEDSTLLMVHHVRMSLPTLKIFTDDWKDQDTKPNLDDYDNDYLESDKDETDDYDDTAMSKKRKRVRIKAPNTELNHAQVTNARIKAEGGESFLLDEGADPLAHHKNSRVLGTFGRRKSAHPTSNSVC